MSSPSGVSLGLSAVCNSSTCTRQMPAPPHHAGWSPPLATHQTGRGFARRCSKPAASLEASLAYSAIDFSRTLLSRLCSLSKTVKALQCTSLRTCSSGSRTLGWPSPRSLGGPPRLAPRSPFKAGAHEASQSALVAEANAVAW